MALVLLFGACGGTGDSGGDGDGDPSICEPGQTQSCSALDDAGVCEGVQSCSEEGSGWLMCACSAGDGDGSGGALGDGDGDSPGDGDGDLPGDGDGDVALGGSSMGGAPSECVLYKSEQADPFAEVHPDASSALARMSVEEKIAMLSGGSICPFKDCDFDAAGVPSLGIQEMQMRDGSRGVHTADGAQATTFAVAMARAASFDPDLEERVGATIGEEMSALQLDLLLAPTLNVLYHPRFGQAQETYGEDPYLAGKMGAAFIRGVQEHVPVCPRAFVAAISGDNRETMSTNMDEQTLRESHARAFEIAVAEGHPGCMMAAYNRLNSVHATEDPFLLTELLRSDWGFSGFVMSEWWATTPQNGALTLNAGLDLEMPDESAFISLSSDYANGAVQLARIDEAALRILNVRAHFGQLESNYKQGAIDTTLVDDPDHIALARETAEKGAVLLENDGILPIAGGVKSIVVMGPDAFVPIKDTITADIAHGLGDRGSSNTYPPHAVSFVDGITARAEQAGITVSTSDDPADAAGADLVIIPVTMSHEDEGEAVGGGGDREALTLSGGHPAHWTVRPSTFIEEVAAVNPNVVVFLAVGSAVTVEDFVDDTRALVQTFYPGQEAGTAIASLLFGDINFQGRLPFSVGKSDADYPHFGNAEDDVAVDYLHGYEKFETEARAPRYWFGYGLSYTTFEYTALSILCEEVSPDGALVAEATITNTGTVAGTEIVQAYVGYPNTAQRRPTKELVGFEVVDLAPGESKTVPFVIPAKDFAYLEEGEGWTVETVEHVFSIASSSDPNAANRLEASLSVR